MILKLCTCKIELYRNLRVKCLGEIPIGSRNMRILRTQGVDVNAIVHFSHMDRVKRIWYLSPMRAAKVQASLRIRAVSPEPSLLAHTSSESRGTFRQKIRSLAPLNDWACAVEICNDGMLEDTKSLDGAQLWCCFQSIKQPDRLTVSIICLKLR